MNTKDRILELLLSEEKSAPALSKELGIRESAIRAHLEALRAEGLVSSGFVRLGRGRPKKVYGLTETGLERFPRRYDVVLESLVSEIEAVDGGRLEYYMRGVAKRLASTLVGEGSDGVSMGESAKILDNLGFRTTYAEKDGRVAIYSANCVVRRLALKHPSQVCTGLHTWLIEGLTRRRNVTLTSCMAYGDAVCVHTLSPRGVKPGSR
ncbi:MAG: ArsR family transcriptional regulator [Candidatus Marsarchaeota archaeon]|nr:ArsR family transcriptional regulator [Candidatus Marsarchaeota archaeon]